VASTAPLPPAGAAPDVSSAREDCAPAVFFGGPDHAPRHLRDVLEQRIEAVPEGGSILWATYYFRDEKLAEALVRAHRRGVFVTLCVEGHPRASSANVAVIRRLKEEIGLGLRVVHHAIPLHLHAKIYGFSHPRPVALVGSYNPSGNELEDRAMLARIGDQDRGYNLLVEIDDPPTVRGLFAWIRDLHRGPLALQWRMRTHPLDPGREDGAALFFPRSRNLLLDRLKALPSGSSVRIAASHVRDGHMAAVLADLARRQVRIELLTGATGRRAPARIEHSLAAAGVTVSRLGGPERVPMHCKFLLAQSEQLRWSAFGSYNFTRTSRWLNYELLMLSSDIGLWRTFDRRWTELVAATRAA
jgi:phosphatidylserine/phosphatidylglycerophosphate/cardiolipin synthase-like enzyme